MAKNYWMVVLTPENYEISRQQEFTLLGLNSRQRKRAKRMEPDDRVLLYVGGSVRKWMVSATITSKYFEDRAPIWQPAGSPNEVFPFRVNMAPLIVMEEADAIDAMILAPRLDYLKRWDPEIWPLAFFETLHLLPQRDFRLIEDEMKRVFRHRRRVRPGRRRQQEGSGRPSVSGAVALAAEEGVTFDEDTIDDGILDFDDESNEPLDLGQDDPKYDYVVVPNGKGRYSNGHNGDAEDEDDEGDES